MHNQNFGLTAGPGFTKNRVQRKGTHPTKQVDHLPGLDYANLQHKVYLIESVSFYMFISLPRDLECFIECNHDSCCSFANGRLQSKRNNHMESYMIHERPRTPL